MATAGTAEAERGGLKSVVKIYATASGLDSIGHVAEAVRRLEDVGAAGVVIGDHFFIRDEGQKMHLFPDPFSLLAAIGALSDRLVLGTMVANVGFSHPALIIRHFAQLAALYGGNRVLAGIGAGWNPEEFEAIGERMPPFNERMDRLEEACILARQLFDSGMGTIEGQHVVARELPLAPRPATPPSLFLGGGSERFLEIAGRYADVLDLNGRTRRGKLGGLTPLRRENVRRMTTTVSDLEDSIGKVAAAATKAGRDPAAVRRLLLVSSLAFCKDAEVSQREQQLGEQLGISTRDLSQCPYVLTGSPARMRDVLTERRERLDLDAVVVPPGPDFEQFCTDVAAKI